jgi:UDP-N-acetylglucosamine acyltransferase
MAKIDPTAILEGNIELDEDVEIGPFSILKGNIKIGKGTKIGSRVSIYHNVEIGENCEIHDGCVIGDAPQHLRDRGEKGKVVIGNNTVLREYVTVNRGTDFDRGVTKIGNNVFLMAYCHVAHDCEVQDNVIMANAATLGGHVVVEHHSFIGGLAAVQQWCRIGAYAMVGGLSGVNKDVPPFTRGAGHHIELKGLNTVALKRNNFSREDINLLKKVYRMLFSGKKPLREALKEVLDLYGDNPHVEYLVRFIKNSIESGRDVATDRTLRKVLVKRETSADGK